jgi:2-phospho-L-lactate/phosphoenolpyruvate guanylyltransferase
MWAVVPLKPFAQAKQRLAGVLSAAERAALMQAMVTDVLTALADSRQLHGILLVSREPQAADIAQRWGAQLYQEPPGTDLSAAVQNAGGLLMSRHQARGTLILPADVPLATAPVIDDLITTHERQQQMLTLVPDSRSLGTNAILSTPPNLIRYQFDGMSFRPHLDGAYGIGITPCVAPNADLGLDIDEPGDLCRLLALARDCHTCDYLIGSGIADRLQTATTDECAPVTARQHR